MDWISDPNSWLALATLTTLEIVLGVDNIIFISILAARLPAHQQARARTVGLAVAMLTRLALLASITWIMSLTEPWFSVFDRDVSGRDLILFGGGLFLIWKSVNEIHASLEGEEPGAGKAVAVTFAAVIGQIAILDVVFSLDSVITAVGLAEDIAIMAIAIVIAVGVMMFAAGPISAFVDQHPTVKMLALSFLVLVGVALVAEGWGFHIPKGYIYFSMAFAIGVEMLNLRLRRKKQQPVRLRQSVPRS
jgi:predicted tellurium resistance membrane protein TerC